MFHHRHVELSTVLVVTDLAPEETETYAERLKKFLGAAPGAEEANYVLVNGTQYRSTGDLLELVDGAKADLICAYRNLHSDGWQWPHSLGESLDLLTQTAEAPVMVLPHPKAGREADHALMNTNRVMAVTDHISGDDRLVNWAVALTEDDGLVFLSHVEDETAFTRIVDAIAKIPSIDTDEARTRIRERLLKDARDYIASVSKDLAARKVHVRVEPVVTLGHRLSDYKRLIKQHEIDLLVLNTRDEDQLAMHGLAYPLAVELRNIPLLML